MLITRASNSTRPTVISGTRVCLIILPAVAIYEALPDLLKFKTGQQHFVGALSSIVHPCKFIRQHPVCKIFKAQASYSAQML